MRIFLVSIVLLFCTRSLAEPVTVGMFYGADHLRATFTVVKGSYSVFSGGEELFEMSTSQSADITASDGKVNIFFSGKNYTGNTRLFLRQTTPAEFKVQPAGQKPGNRIYKENMIAFAYSGRLQMVNEIELEEYVSGVIEAESGSGSELEYYKVQAVISRTYALNNLNRHSAEGFQLCDATHCQVYHGKPRSEPLAMIATAATKDIVIVDPDINLITAAFHSNCGGRTINAEDVWSKPVSYLVGRPDTFCLKMPHSNWEKTIPQERWTSYLESKRYPLSDDPGAESLSWYPTEKQVFFVDSTCRIPLRTIREDMKLRSTFFTLQCDGTNATFTGQGFGHGVGLCQEGAMRMALLDYCYEDIIHFYYKDVHLIPRYMMWFFRE